MTVSRNTHDTFGPTLTVVLIVSFAGLAWADHCDESLFVPGPPEKQLAGVTVFTQIEQVTAVLGKPTQHRDFTGPEYPAGGGEAEYTWLEGSAVVTIGTMYHADANGARNETVCTIELRGSRSNRRSYDNCCEQGAGCAWGMLARPLKRCTEHGQFVTMT